MKLFQSHAWVDVRDPCHMFLFSSWAFSFASGQPSEKRLCIRKQGLLSGSILCKSLPGRSWRSTLRLHRFRSWNTDWILIWWVLWDSCQTGLQWVTSRGPPAQTISAFSSSVVCQRKRCQFDWWFCDLYWCFYPKWVQEHLSTSYTFSFCKSKHCSIWTKSSINQS